MKTISPMERAEKLSLEQFVALTEDLLRLNKQCQSAALKTSTLDTGKTTQDS